MQKPKFSGWIANHSLWLVALGLMLASSGLDGIYMSKWMPVGVNWLGLVLNTMSDIGNLVIMYWYGRLRQSPRGSKRYKLAGVLLPSELVAVTYSWFFSWRQLRAVLPAIEPENWRWVAPVAAGFIPLLLAFIGYAQSLLAGKLDEEPARARTSARVSQMIAEPEPALPYACQHCKRAFATMQALNAHQRSHKTNGSQPEPILEERAVQE